MKLALVQSIHFENLRMDAGEFEPSTLRIELAIDWHANPLSHHGTNYEVCCAVNVYLKLRFRLLNVC